MAAHGNSGRDAVGPAGSVARSGRWSRFGPWLVGLALGLVLLGPDLAPGPIFTLDLILPDDVPVPMGVWGLGPELPRRVPLWVVVGWLSPLLGGANVGKALMVATIAVAFVGAYRLAAELGRDADGETDGETDGASGERAVLVAGAAGLLYAASPFLLTRLSVGHMMVTVPMALLPWVLPTLLAPDRRMHRTFLAVFALAFAGHFGGVLAGVVVVVGLCLRRFRRAPAVVGVVVAAQLPWLVPGLIVSRTGGSLATAAPFATDASGLDGAGRLLAGHGFWLGAYQVGRGTGWVAAVAGVMLLGLAVVGTTRLRPPMRTGLVALAVIGLATAAASAIPGVRDGYDWLTDNRVGLLVREGQRMLPLYLVWMCLSAPIGAWRLGGRLSGGGPAMLVRAVPLALAVALALPGLWGIDPRMRPLDLPPEWAQLRALVRDAPGPVAALPWHQYIDFDVGGTRRVLHPLPLDLGGDVLASTDPELGPSVQEGVDPREAVMDSIVDDARTGRPVSDRLARLGVRWVVVLHQADWLDTPGISPADPGLRVALAAPTLDVYEVRAWPGLVADADGRPVAADPVVEPWARVAASGPATYTRPAVDGWLRGTTNAGRTDQGLLALPPGDGPVWYWPVLVVLLGDLVTAVGVLASLWTEWRAGGHQSPERAGSADG